MPGGVGGAVCAGDRTTRAPSGGWLVATPSRARPVAFRAALGLMTALDNAGERAEALRRGQAYEEAGAFRGSAADPSGEVSEWLERHRHVAGNRLTGNGAKPSNQPPTIMASVVEAEGAVAEVQAVSGSLIRRVHRGTRC